MRLLPIGERDPDLGSIGEGNEAAGIADAPEDFLFEPTPEAVLESLLPRLVELSVYQVIAEALASEHSSRMVTMQNATKAADDLIGDFTLTYNRARQAAITAELADITGGRLAVAA
jgi:F-type H+-transporting ATPase subunit gamma